MKNLKSNNYYSFSQLKSYSENKTDLDNDDISTDYYIEDPDGFTNLREQKDVNSKILQTIKNGEKVEVLNSEGNWWLIKTQGGKEGYVYYNRIKIK